MAACFCVVSFDASASGGGGGAGAREGSTAAMSLASTSETRSSLGVSSTITEGGFATGLERFAVWVVVRVTAEASAAVVVALRVAFVVALGAVLAALVVALDAVLAAFIVAGATAGAGAIGAAALAGAAAFIGSVLPRNGEPVVVGDEAGFAEDAGVTGRAPGSGGEKFDGVGRCGEGPGPAGFAGDGFAGVGLDLFVAIGAADSAASPGTEFPPFAGCDGSPMPPT
jgi:hypothetical protein